MDFCPPNHSRLSKSSGGGSGESPSFAEAMAEEYRKYQEEHGITDDELEEFGECAHVEEKSFRFDRRRRKALRHR